MEEREYSVLEIVKVNLKNWKVLLAAAAVCAVVMGIYQYRETGTVVQYYYETSQMNASFYMKEYNSESITERFLSVKALADSYTAYEYFMDKAGCELTYEEYQQLMQFSDGQLIEVQQIYFAYPGVYGSLDIQTEEQALEVAGLLTDTLLAICDTYVGEGCISVLDSGYTTVITHYEVGTPTTGKDLLNKVLEGVIAGAFFGFVVAFLLVSVGYMAGTVTKTAEEIKAGLGAPVLGFVRPGKRREEEIKKVGVFFEERTHCVIHFLPFAEKGTNGAKDLADSYAAFGRDVLYLDCGPSGEANPVTEYVRGKGTAEAAKAYLAKAAAEHTYVILRSTDLKTSADGYRLAGLADENVISCRRRSTSGTWMHDVRTTFEVNGIHLTGAVVYGN